MLLVNKNVRFLSQDVVLEVATNKSIYTKLMKKNEKLTMPIAHKQGNYIANKDVIDKLNIVYSSF